MALALVLLPVAWALGLYLLPSPRWRPRLLPVLAVLHLALLALVLARPERGGAGGAWLRVDPLGALLLGLLAVLFLVLSLYAPSYLWLRRDRGSRAFCACLALFLGLSSLVALAQHLGLLWVAMESLTLATAPLIYFNRNQRSIEATWKYLMIGSVGIALALLGSFFLSYAAFLGGRESSLLFASLAAEAGNLSRPWLRAGFVLLLIGYGTKMGIAPLHTWKPDAYGEAPGLVGALLAGGSTSCAFVALLRVFHIVALGGEAAFARRLVLVLGLFSMLWVAVFMARQRDIKRMLAYSSVEQMGVLLVGLGLGAVFPALLHMANNALTKGWMFLAAGNIHRAFGSKRVRDVAGAARLLPVSGLLFLLGMLAVTGSPPFAPFTSLFSIFEAAVEGGRMWIAAAFLSLLAAVFLGMGSTVVRVVAGEPPAERALARNGDAGATFRDDLPRTAPILVFAALVLALGLWLPSPLADLLSEAASTVGGAP
jgi:hydrogenase-4 component F